MPPWSGILLFLANLLILFGLGSGITCLQCQSPGLPCDITKNIGDPDARCFVGYGEKNEDPYVQGFMKTSDCSKSMSFWENHFKTQGGFQWFNITCCNSYKCNADWEEAGGKMPRYEDNNASPLEDDQKVQFDGSNDKSSTTTTTTVTTTTTTTSTTTKSTTEAQNSQDTVGFGTGNSQSNNENQDSDNQSDGVGFNNEQSNNDDATANSDNVGFENQEENTSPHQNEDNIDFPGQTSEGDTGANDNENTNNEASNSDEVNNQNTGNTEMGNDNVGFDQKDDDINEDESNGSQAIDDQVGFDQDQNSNPSDPAEQPIATTSSSQDDQASLSEVKFTPAGGGDSTERSQDQQDVEFGSPNVPETDSANDIEVSDSDSSVDFVNPVDTGEESAADPPTEVSDEGANKDETVNFVPNDKENEIEQETNEIPKVLVNSDGFQIRFESVPVVKEEQKKQAAAESADPKEDKSSIAEADEADIKTGSFTHADNGAICDMLPKYLIFVPVVVWAICTK